MKGFKLTKPFRLEEQEIIEKNELGSAKVKITKALLTLADVLIGLLGLGVEFLILLTDYGVLTYIFMTVILGIFICLYLPISGERLYLQIVLIC